MPSREFRKVLQGHQRSVMRQLRRDRPKLFRALDEFANIRSDAEGWAHFRKRWPNFFPAHYYDTVNDGSKQNILGYPYWLHHVWLNWELGEMALPILLGIDPNPERTEGTPEEAWLSDLVSIPGAFYVDWDEGVFRYRGACDFQRALYLLFLDSWRARFCEKCKAKFIAKRAAQKFCTTDCSAAMQREFRRRWWAEHGTAWRQKRQKSKLKKKGVKNVADKTR
jgi:hypothetical protein